MARKQSVKPFEFFFNVRGVDQNAGVYSVKPDAAELIENMNVDTLGQWSAYNEGYSAFTSQIESGAAIDSLGWYTDASGTDYMLAACNGKIKNINPSTGAITSEISTGFTAGDKVDFATFKGTVYATSKSLTPQKWSGSGSMTSTSLFPMTLGSDTYDKPKFLERFYNRVAYANFNGATKYPSHILISDDLAAETITTTSPTATSGIIVQVGPGDGQSIVGMKKLLFPLDNETILVVFKDRSTWAVRGNTYADFSVLPLNEEYGALSNQTILTVGSDLIFLGINNICSLATATDSGTIQPKTIGDSQVKATLESLNLTAKEAAWGVHLPRRQEVWFGIPTGSNTKPNVAIVAHYELNEKKEATYTWSIRRLMNGSTFVATCPLLLNRDFYTGSDDGYINIWHGDSMYGDSGASWRYRYPFFDFGTPHQNKRVLEAAAWFLMRGSDTITFTTEWRGNGDLKKSFSRSIDIGTGATPLYGTSSPPAAVYGVNVYGDGAILKKIKIPVHGSGRQLQFTVQGTTGTTGPIFLGISGLVEYGEYDRSYR